MEVFSRDKRELDAREMSPPKRHGTIRGKFQNRRTSEVPIIVNDHGPKPLFYQTKEEMEGELRWEYVESDGEEWKVLIGKQ